MSNIYILNMRIIPNAFNCEYLDCRFNSEIIFYSLEDAIEYGKSEFVYMYNNYYNDSSNKNPSIIDLEEFIKEKSIQYFFDIKIVSGNRKKFNTCAELMDYYNKHVKDIPNDNLFNFLLTLVDSYDISYDFKGNIISEEIIPQKFLKNDMVDYQFDFSPESCSKGIVYKFYYLDSSENNIYIIKDFDCKTDIHIEYPLTNRPIYHSEEEALKTIRSALNYIQATYEKKTDRSYGRDKFFSLFKPTIEISVINTNHKSIKTKEEYVKYLEEFQIIPKEELRDYILSYTDNCILSYDHNLNLKGIYCKPELFTI